MVDYSLLGNLPNAGQGFMNGYTQSRDMLREEAGRNALSAYAQNPNDPQAMNALAQADPRMALQARAQQQEYAAKMQKQQQDMAEQGVKTAGQLALQVAGLPEDQRSAAWDNSIDQLAASFPGASQYKGKYSPDMLRYVLSQAGLGDEAMRQAQGRIVVVPQGGEMRRLDINGNEIGFGGAAPQTDGPIDEATYRSLPPGTEFTAPDGTRKRKPGGAPVQAGATFP